MLRAWHKRFFVLKDETSERGPALEMYKSPEEARVVVSPWLSLDLAQTVHVGFTSDSKRFPNALVLVCQGRSPLLLAAHDELGSRSWLLALGLIAHKASAQHAWRFMCKKAPEEPPVGRCTSSGALYGASSDASAAATEVSSVQHRLSVNTDADSMTGSLDGVVIPPPLEYGDGCLDALFSRERFLVTVSPTEASERLALRGEYQLLILGHSVGLVQPGSRQCTIVWPVTCIRQYRHELLLSEHARSKTTMVTIEVGRRCCTGEGLFQFRTQRGQEVIRELKRAVALWAARKAALASWCQSRAVAAAQRSSLRLGRSAPATPSLSMPPAWRRPHVVDSPPDHSSSSGDDFNYIVPAFQRSASSLGDDSGLPSPRMPRPCRSDPGDHLVEGDDDDEDDSNYVRISSIGGPVNVHRVSFRNTVVPDKTLQELRNAEGYIEVLPT